MSFRLGYSHLKGLITSAGEWAQIALDGPGSNNRPMVREPAYSGQHVVGRRSDKLNRYVR